MRRRFLRLDYRWIWDTPELYAVLHASALVSSSFFEPYCIQDVPVVVRTGWFYVLDRLSRKYDGSLAECLLEQIKVEVSSLLLRQCCDFATRGSLPETQR